jgi:chromosome segregation ATPase
MAVNRIKGITIEINGDTTKLQTSLKDTDKKLKTTKDYLKDIDNLLKLDPGNIDLLKQKEKYLNDEIETTKTRLKELKSVSQDSLSPEQWDNLQREIVDTEQKLEGLEKDYKDFGSVAKQQLQAAADKVGDMGKKLEDAGRKFQPLSTAASAVGAALIGLGMNAVESADEISTLAQQTGLSTDEIQKFKYASELVDVELSAMTGALTKVKKNMTGHDELWDKLGISVTNADGSMRNATDVFYESLEALSQIENETERDQTAMDLFGKSADSLAGIIDDGGAALKEYGQQAEDMGLILSGDTLDALNTTGDTIEQVKQQFTTSAAELGAAVMTTLQPLIEKALGWVDDITEKMRSLSPEEMEVALQVIAITAAIGPLLTAGGKVLGGMSLIMAHPLIAGGVLLGGLLAAAIMDTYEHTEKWGDYTRTTSDELNDLNGRIDASREALDKARESRENNIEKIESEWDHTKKLKKELDGLVDENGRVKKGYENRAKFIVGKLSDALDMEIKYNDGIIEGYQDISAEIDNMIETRKRAAIMAAFEEEYQTAVKNSTQAQKNLSEAVEYARQVSSNYNTQRRKVHDLEMAINAVNKDGVDIQAALNGLGEVGRQIWAEYYEEGDTGYEITKKLTDAYEEQADNLSAMEDEYVVATEAVANADQTYQDYQHTIEHYEGAMEAAAASDTEGVTKHLDELKAGYEGAANEYEKNLQKMVTDAEREYENLKQKVAAGEDGVTQKEVDEQGIRMQELQKHLADYRNEVTNAFEKLPSEAATAMNKKASELNGAGQTLAGQAIGGISTGLDQAEAYGTSYAGRYGSGIINNAQAGYNGARYLVGQADAAASDNSGADKAGSLWGEGYYNGMERWRQHVVDKAWQIATEAVNSANYAQISRSPSRAMMKAGENFGKGYEIGIESERLAVQDAAEDLANTAIGAASGAPDVNGLFSASAGFGGTVNNSSVSYGATNINIYAQPGMDVNELADAVQNRLALLQRQREAAYA